MWLQPIVESLSEGTVHGPAEVISLPPFMVPSSSPLLESVVATRFQTFSCPFVLRTWCQRRCGCDTAASDSAGTPAPPSSPSCPSRSTHIQAESTHPHTHPQPPFTATKPTHLVWKVRVLNGWQIHHDPLADHRISWRCEQLELCVAFVETAQHHATLRVSGHGGNEWSG